jgi:hypothetical protein
MKGDTPLKFGTVEVAAAYVTDGKFLRLKLLDGLLNRVELGMLIRFLQAKQDQLDAPSAFECRYSEARNLQY